MSAVITESMPHTGMQVPHTRCHLVTPGIIDFDGQQHQILLDPDDDFAEKCVGPAADAFFDWATQCRAENGDPLDTEDVFDFLRAEYATGRALRRAAEDGCTIVQAMVPHGEGYLPSTTLRVYPDETRQHVIDLTQHTGGPVGTWWRLFDGTGWVELNPMQ
jgi:hypothetical protein